MLNVASSSGRQRNVTPPDGTSSATSSSIKSRTTWPFQARALRVLLLAAGAASLAVGLWSGLARVGVMLPGGMPQIADRHGALMICGFFGTVISLERAVAVGRGWAYAAPGFSAAGVLALVFGAPAPVSIAAFLAASLVLTITSASIVLRQPALFTVGLTVAAASWAIGTVLWLLSRPVAEFAGWWLAFLVLTIAAERLELSRVIRVSRSAQAVFAAAVITVLAGAALGELTRPFAPFTGMGLLGCAAWLFVNDVARRTVRQTGQIRFSASCMLAGYAWLALAGALLLFSPRANAFTFDAAVHAITIGFVLSMIFGHALIILPAVTGLRASYAPALYAPLVFLHLSVAIRVLADLREMPDLRVGSGILTVISLAAFAATLVIASIRNNASAS